MKKSLLIVLMLFIATLGYGQRTVFNGGPMTRDVPAVTISMTDVTATGYTASFTKNADCSYYYYLTMSTDEIAQWTTMMGMTIEQLIQLWGVLANEDDTHTWTEQTPNTEYNVFALPFGSDSVAAAYSVATFNTNNQGGTGTASVQVAVSNITDTSALIVCTPNDQTSSFHDGVIMVDYFNEIGQDSAVRYFANNPLFYSTDSWEWLSLNPSTDYYVVAFGYNVNNEMGDVTLYPFRTLGTSGINDVKSNSCTLFPIPNDGYFEVKGENISGSLMKIYSMEGKLLLSQRLDNNEMTICTTLSSGAYLVLIANSSGSLLYSGKMIVEK